MGPDLCGEELPLFHFVELESLVGCQLHGGLVVPQGLDWESRLDVKDGVLLVCLSLLFHSLYHVFKVTLGVLLLQLTLLFQKTILSRQVLISILSALFRIYGGISWFSTLLLIKLLLYCTLVNILHIDNLNHFLSLLFGRLFDHLKITRHTPQPILLQKCRIQMIRILPL